MIWKVFLTHGYTFKIIKITLNVFTISLKTLQRPLLLDWPGLFGVKFEYNLPLKGCRDEILRRGRAFLVSGLTKCDILELYEKCGTLSLCREN